MFTGIIRQLGTAAGLSGRTLRVKARLERQPAGASVAVNGACLTVTRHSAGILSFDVSAETLARTNLGALKPGDPVNLEPALRACDPVGGHWVTGHVDAAAPILEREALPGGFERLRAAWPEALRGLAAVKGSMAVDGVSLTVTATGEGFVETVLIPETLRRTTLGRRRPGDAVNLEADLVARYLKSLVEARR